MALSDHPLDEQLEAALDAATDESARYHIRQALQIQRLERELPDDEVPA